MVVLVAGCGGSGSDPLADDQGAPLALEHGATTERDGVRVEEISYGSGDDRVEAYLVSPLGTAVEKLPAVVFLHGSGDDRTEQLDTAVALAKRGSVAMTITAPSRGKTAPAGATGEDLVRWQGGTIAADVVAVRRALGAWK